MGDRVAVLKGGDLQQCDTPQGLFFHPANIFVAAFIGSPAMNLFEAAVSVDRTSLMLGSQRITLPKMTASAYPGLERYAGGKLVVGIRPEDLVAPGDLDASDAVFGARVDLVEALGSELLVHIQLDASRVRPEGTDVSQEVGLPDVTFEVKGEGVARVDHRWGVKPGDLLELSVKSDRLYFFDPDTGIAIEHEPS